MKKSVALLLFLLTAGIRLAIELTTGYTVDDAFITFRFAENLAAGAGFVYNLGERVLGTTTPLFTIVIALLNAVGFSSLTGAQLVNIPAAGFTSVVLYSWSHRLRFENLSLLPPFLYALFPRSIVADICGMETALFTLLLTSSFYLLYRKKQLLSLTVAAVAAVVRPEGLALLAVALVMTAGTSRRAISFKIAPVLLIVGNWLLFSYLYFGTLVPNSVIAKSALYQTHWNLGFWESLVFLLGLNTAVGWAILISALAGMLIAMRQNRHFLLIGCFALAYLVALAASGTHLFFWYAAPIYPLLFLVVIFALHKAIQSNLRFRRLKSAWITSLLCLLMAAAATPRLFDKVRLLQWEMEAYSQIHNRAGEFLRERAGPADRVLAEDIGHLGHIYRGKIIDRDGLVTPEAIPYNRQGAYKRFVDSVAADWVFIVVGSPTSTAVLGDATFEQRYKLILKFGVTGSDEYALYRKRAYFVLPPGPGTG